MLSEYAGLLLLLLLGLALLGVLLAVHRLRGSSRLVGERRLHSSADDWQRIAAHRRHALRFYTAAIVFVVFLAQTPFFYAWGAVFGELRVYGVVVIGIFSLPFAVGLYYGWMKGALEW